MSQSADAYPVTKYRSHSSWCNELRNRDFNLTKEGLAGLKGSPRQLPLGGAISIVTLYLLIFYPTIQLNQFVSMNYQYTFSPPFRKNVVPP